MLCEPASLPPERLLLSTSAAARGSEWGGQLVRRHLPPVTAGWSSSKGGPGIASKLTERREAMATAEEDGRDKWLCPVCQH